MTGPMISCCRAQRSSAGQSPPSRTIFLVARTASGPLWVILRASSSAPASASPGSVTRLTRPHVWASSAEKNSPVSAYSIAIARGMRWGSRNSPPAPATSERFASGRPNLASRAATMRSHASVISQPPANA